MSNCSWTNDQNSRGDRMQEELVREWDDQPIFAGIGQDDDLDATPTQTFVKHKRTPPLEPVMESSQLPRPQRYRCKPPWLEDYKLRRVKRTRHLRHRSPTGQSCSSGVSADTNNEPTLRVLTLRCNMIRSEVHDMRRQEQCRSDSFDLAHQVFGDGAPRRRVAMSEPRRGARSEFRVPAAERRHSEDRQQPRFDRRHGQDVPFDRESRVLPLMENRGFDRRPWEERLHRIPSPRFERGRRPFRGGGMARGRPYMMRYGAIGSGIISVSSTTS